MQQTKWCPKCSIEKLLSDFGRNKSKYDGRTRWCKLCLKQYYRNRKAQLVAIEPSLTDHQRDQIDANRECVKIEMQQRLMRLNLIERT